MSDQGRHAKLERLEQALLHLSRHHARPDSASPQVLTLVQYVTLLYVAHEPQLVSHVARHLGITNAGTTGLLDRLCSQGLVRRYRDEQDRRLVWVSIAPKGHAVIQAMRAQRQQRIAGLFAALDDEDLDQFLGLVEKLIAPARVSGED